MTTTDGTPPPRFWRLSKIVLALLPLLGAAILFDAYWSTLPQSVIVTCWHESVGHHRDVVVATTSGATIHASLPSCPTGIIEKRRGEAFYRVDLEPFGSAWRMTFKGWLILIGGTILDVVLLVRWRSARRARLA